MQKLSTKAVLDGRIADALDLEPALVARVTRQLLFELIRELSSVASTRFESVGVRLDGFGVLRIRAHGGKRCILEKGTFKKKEHGGKHVVESGPKYYVTFRKSGAFKDALRARKEKRHGQIFRRRERERAGGTREEGSSGLP